MTRFEKVRTASMTSEVDLRDESTFTHETRGCCAQSSHTSSSARLVDELGAASLMLRAGNDQPNQERDLIML